MKIYICVEIYSRDLRDYYRPTANRTDSHETVYSTYVVLQNANYCKVVLADPTFILSLKFNSYSVRVKIVQSFF